MAVPLLSIVDVQPINSDHVQSNKGTPETVAHILGLKPTLKLAIEAPPNWLVLFELTADGVCADPEDRLERSEDRPSASSPSSPPTPPRSPRRRRLNPFDPPRLLPSRQDPHLPRAPLLSASSYPSTIEVLSHR